MQLNFDTINSFKWTIVKTVLTLMFSALGILLIHFISDFSLYLEHTRNEGSTITKIALFQLINSFLVPVLAFVAIIRNSSRLWCVPYIWCLLQPASTGVLLCHDNVENQPSLPSPTYPCMHVRLCSSESFLGTAGPLVITEHSSVLSSACIAKECAQQNPPSSPTKCT